MTLILRVGVIVLVFVSFVPHRVAKKLLHRVRRDTLQRDARGDIFFESYLRAEHDAVSLDVLRGGELGVVHLCLGVALAL